MKNRYMIGEKECFVVFYKDNFGKLKSNCTLYIGKWEFTIRVELLELIATPAP